MYRSIISLSLACQVFFTAGSVMANDYLFGGMTSTPTVTRFRVAAVPSVVPVTQPPHQSALGAPIVVNSPVTAPVPQTLPRAYVGPMAAPVPIRAYSPVVAPAPVVAARPVYVGRPVVTRTKFYVPGQPIRNVFRWLGPGVPTGVAVLP